MRSLNFLLSSAGRRPYLLRWFKEAAARRGVNAKIFLADSDSLTPARGLADYFILAPPAGHDGYIDWLEDTLGMNEIDCALSVNDFELSKWALEVPRSDKFSSLIRLAPNLHELIEDKYRMAQWLQRSDVLTPSTYLASEFFECNVASESFRNGAITKGRYGSGSRGLSFNRLDSLQSAVANASMSVTTRDGKLASNSKVAAALTVIQPKIVGQEYGLDIVSDFNGKFVTVLSRQKLTMRGGETDKAVTCDSATFLNLGRRISELLLHRGLIDVDVIVDEDGQAWVIDINPRFGGGYPFSHLAGADIPSAYIDWTTGLNADQEAFTYETGVTSAKFIETAVV